MAMNIFRIKDGESIGAGELKWPQRLRGAVGLSLCGSVAKQM
jgi:hypothetical protein